MDSCRQPVSGFPRQRLLTLAIESVFVGFLLSPVLVPGIAMASDNSAVIEKVFAIGPGKLSDVLAQFAATANVPLSFDPAPLAHIDSAGLQGSFTVSNGFKTLLAGTGFTVNDQGDNTFSLRKIPQQSVVSQERALPQLTVQAARDTVTEGNPSYTVGAMRTATKMELSMRETPQSVTVVTRQRIDDQGLESLSDALKQATGVKVQEAEVHGTNFQIRGFTLDTMQIDGMPVTLLGSDSNPSIDLAIYDRIEILRGAAGLLQGAASPGGTINVVRKMPAKEFSAQGAVRAGSWRNYRADIDVSTPVNTDGTLRTRFVAAVEDRHSFIDFVKERKDILYGVVQYDVTSALTATVGVDYQHTRGVPQGTGIVFYNDGGDLGLPRNTYLGARWNRRTTDTTNLFGDLAWQLGGGWTAKLASSYQWYNADKVFLSASGSGVDRSTGMGPVLNYASASGTNNTQAGLDASLAGPFTLFGKTHELVVGANARRGNNGSGSVPLRGYSGIKPDVWHWDPTSLPPPVIGAFNSTTQTVAKQTGIYATTRLKVAEPLTLMLGARASWWDYDSKTTNVTTGKVTPTAYRVSRQITPYAGIVFDLNDRFSLYASYTDVFQPQNAIDRNGQLLDPVIGANYEAGIKGEFMDGRLNTSLAVFRIDQTNLAQTDVNGPRPCPYNTDDYCSIAEGKVRSEGVELDVSGELAPGWQLSAGHTFNTTKYLKDRTREGLPFNSRTPKHMTKFFTSYRLPGALNKFTLGGGFTWQSEFIYEYGPTRITQGAYAVADAMLRYDITPKLSATLNVANLLDKRYYRYISHERAYNYYGEPRNVMLTLRARFD